jgi:hypothetical protein
MITSLNANHCLLGLTLNGRFSKDGFRALENVLLDPESKLEVLSLRNFFTGDDIKWTYQQPDKVVEGWETLSSVLRKSHAFEF